MKGDVARQREAFYMGSLQKQGLQTLGSQWTRVQRSNTLVVRAQQRLEAGRYESQLQRRPKEGRYDERTTAKDEGNGIGGQHKSRLQLT